MLDIRDVYFQYENFSCTYQLQAEESNLALISGDNGSGKTTLLMLIAGFLTPSRGEIYWKSNCLNNEAPHNRPISILFQTHNLFPHLTVEQNIMIGFSHNKKLTELQKHTLDDVMTFFELTHIRKQFPSHLSGGQAQRVALARCMIRRMPIILLDEPLNHLDAASKEQFVHWIELYMTKEKPCILIASHEIALFNNIMTHHFYIQNGTISQMD